MRFQFRQLTFVCALGLTAVPNAVADPVVFDFTFKVIGVQGTPHLFFGAPPIQFDDLISGTFTFDFENTFTPCRCPYTGAVTYQSPSGGFQLNLGAAPFLPGAVIGVVSHNPGQPGDEVYFFQDNPPSLRDLGRQHFQVNMGGPAEFLYDSSLPTPQRIADLTNEGVAFFRSPEGEFRGFLRSWDLRDAAPVSEPGSLSLLASGVCALLAGRASKANKRRAAQGRETA